jgi:hypothetical protein
MKALLCIKCYLIFGSIRYLTGAQTPGREGARFSQAVQTGSEAHPNLCKIGTGFFLLWILMASFRFNHNFLGACTKFRKTSISFVVFVHPSVLPFTWNNSAPSRWIFINFVWRLVRKRPLERRRHRWQGNIKIDFHEIG